MVISKNKTIRILTAFLLIFALIFGFSGCTVARKIKNKIDPPDPITERPSVRLTFPEGSTVAEIAKILESGNVCTADEFLTTAQNAALLGEYGFEIPNPENRSFVLEGYLFPDTYDFYVGEGSEAAAKRFLKNSQKKLGTEIREKCAETGFTLDEILALASIIQEEAGNPADMGMVSSVLHNRLASDAFPKLQCDAVTFYLRDSVEPYVTPERYEYLSGLYGTYLREGLPEGPITNSGIDAVNAALNPEESDYYYFITDSENVYHYAETYKEHLRNCENAGLV